MSTTTIEKAVQILRELPDSQQQAVIDYLTSLKTSAPAGAMLSETPPALVWENGLLVHTGAPEGPLGDPVAEDRAARLAHLERLASSN